jgi:hypothetical protein
VCGVLVLTWSGALPFPTGSRLQKRAAPSTTPSLKTLLPTNYILPTPAQVSKNPTRCPPSRSTLHLSPPSPPLHHHHHHHPTLSPQFSAHPLATPSWKSKEQSTCPLSPPQNPLRAHQPTKHPSAASYSQTTHPIPSREAPPG